jgi:hypothetical protein
MTLAAFAALFFVLVLFQTAGMSSFLIESILLTSYQSLRHPLWSHGQWISTTKTGTMLIRPAFFN